MRVLSECNLAQIVVDILDGKTIVFPTETSYGLGCDATNQAAVDKIFKIKGRKSFKPLLVVVPTVEMAKKYLVWNETLEKIAAEHWPGPLTVVGEYRSHPLLSKGEGRERSRLLSLDRVPAHLDTLAFRKELRQNQTKAEKLLWSSLRAGRLGGLKFKRQFGIGPYIVDFYHGDSQTVIELDGDIHFALESQEKKDRVREEWLKSNGYRIIRYNNVDIFNNLEWILKEIYETLVTARPLSALSPLQRREELASGVVSRDNTVAIRVTAHPLLKSITEKLGRPLVATSANIADTGDIYSADEIVSQFKDREAQPDIILNQGELLKNLPTTIVSVLHNEVKILRQGEVEVSED